MKIHSVFPAASATALLFVLCAGSAVRTSPVGVLPGAPLDVIGETARQIAIRTDDGLTRFGSVTQAERNRLWEAMLPMADDGPTGALSESFGPAVGPYDEVLKHMLKDGGAVGEGCTSEHSTPGRIRALGPRAAGSPTALSIWEDMKWRSVVDETIVHLPAAEAGRLMARRVSEDCRAYERPDGLRAELYADHVTEKPGRSRRVTIFTLIAENGGWAFEYQSMTRIGDYVVLLNVSPLDHMKPDDHDALVNEAEEHAMAALA